MRIGIDYLPATTHAPGVGRYARELVRALVGLGSDHELRLLEFGLERRSVGDLGLEAAGRGVVRRRVPLPRRLLASRLCPGVDRLAGGVDVFHHVLPGALPVSRSLRSIFLSEVPAPGSPGAARLAAEVAGMDAVLVCSQGAAADVVAGLGLGEQRVHVVPVGCDHWSRCHKPRDAPSAPATVLVLGAPSPSRHPRVILDAWRLLRRRGHECELRFVGGPARDDGVLEAALSDEPHARHDLPHESELPAVVADAASLVHLSDAESTAVTPLEAFSFGVPVVASDLPAFRETLGDEARLLPNAALDAEPSVLADAMALALEGAGEAAGRARRRGVARGYTWRRNAEATLEIWSGLVG